MNYTSYTLGREYRVMRNRYSRLLFTSEDRLCAICACKNNRQIWRHNASISRSRDVTDPLWWRHVRNDRPWRQLRNERSMIVLAELCVQDIKKRVRNKIIHSLPWITIFGSLVMRFANDFHSWLCHSWKSLANHPTRDPKLVIHGNSCIILYILQCKPATRPTGPRLNIKTVLSTYGDFHVKDKTAVRTSYL